MLGRVTIHPIPPKPKSSYLSLFFKPTPPDEIKPKKTEIEVKQCDIEPSAEPIFANHISQELRTIIKNYLENQSKKYSKTQLPPDPVLITAFHSASPPSMSISAYLQRMIEFVRISESTVIVAIALLALIEKHIPGYTDNYTIHRLVLTSLCVAHKFTDDEVYNNASFANVGGISSKELRSLEVEFLTLINYRNVKFEEYQDMLCKLLDFKSSIKNIPCLPARPGIIDSQIETPSSLSPYLDICRIHTPPTTHEFKIFKPTQRPVIPIFPKRGIPCHPDLY